MMILACTPHASLLTAFVVFGNVATTFIQFKDVATEYDEGFTHVEALDTCVYFPPCLIIKPLELATDTLVTPIMGRSIGIEKQTSFPEFVTYPLHL